MDLEWIENSPKGMIEIFRSIKKNYQRICGLRKEVPKRKVVVHLPDMDPMAVQLLFNRLNGANVRLNTDSWTLSNATESYHQTSFWLWFTTQRFFNVHEKVAKDE